MAIHSRVAQTRERRARLGVLASGLPSSGSFLPPPPTPTPHDTFACWAW